MITVTLTVLLSFCIYFWSRNNFFWVSFFSVSLTLLTFLFHKLQLQNTPDKVGLKFMKV